MFKAFRDRRPWAAIVLCLLIGPWLGMAFLNRGRWALIYLAALLGLVLLIVEFLPGAYLPAGRSIKPTLQNLNMVLALIGAVHAYFIARKWNPEQRLAWYSRRWHLILIVPALFVLSLLGIRSFAYQPFNIPSASMFPSVGVGDAILVSKSAYSSSSPQRGDLVVFWAEHYHAYFIKRVIGLPGDHVQMIDGRLVLNKTKLPLRRVENYSKSCDPGYGCSVPQYEETYPGGKIVRVLDTISNGPLDNTEVFEVPVGAYFVLGDNRDNSNDSRDAEFGPVPRSAIVGKAAYKYVSASHWVWQSIR